MIVADELKQKRAELVCRRQTSDPEQAATIDKLSSQADDIINFNGQGRKG